jgi:hypothetical protein
MLPEPRPRHRHRHRLRFHQSPPSTPMVVPHRDDLVFTSLGRGHDLGAPSGAPRPRVNPAPGHDAAEHRRAAPATPTSRSFAKGRGCDTNLAVAASRRSTASSSPSLVFGQHREHGAPPCPRLRPGRPRGRPAAPSPVPAHQP